MTEYLQYNSPVVLTFFFVSFFVLILNWITKGISNTLLFSTYKSSVLSPLTYIRLFDLCLYIHFELLLHLLLS